MDTCVGGTWIPYFLWNTLKISLDWGCFPKKKLCLKECRWDLSCMQKRAITIPAAIYKQNMLNVFECVHQLNAAGLLIFIRVYVPRVLYNLTLQLVQRVIKCICWKGHCLEDWTCFTALVENYIKLCPSDRRPSEGKPACQVMWWVITRTWTRVCFRRFQEQNRGCKPNSAPPPFF